MNIGLKRHAEMLVAAVALLVMTLAVLPGVAQAQGTDGASVEAAQNPNRDAYYYATASRPSAQPATRLVVVPGDSLWSISQKRLGPEAAPAQVANEVERIFEANRDRIGDDPNLIFAGQELLLPSVSEPVSSVPAPSVPAPSEPATNVSAPSERAPSVPEANEPAANVPATSVPEANEPATSAPATDSGRTIEPTFRQDERRLVGLGIIVLTFVLVGLMAWKLPLSRDTEQGAWGIAVGHPDYHGVPPTFGGKAFANKHDDFDRAGITGAAGGRRKATPRVRTSGPKRLPRRGWATGVHNPQVRRFLKRPPGAGGRRASPPTRKPSSDGGGP